jgi:plastocyanin
MRFSSQSLAASLLVTGQVLATKHEQMQSIAYGASSAVAYGASSAVAYGASSAVAYGASSTVAYATSSASAAAVTATYAATATVSAAAGHETVHVVQVGGTNGSTIFSPSNVVAKPGDLVQFQFNAKVRLPLLHSTLGS